MRRLTTSLALGAFFVWWAAPAWMNAQDAAKPVKPAPAKPTPAAPAEKNSAPVEPPVLIPPPPVQPPGSGPTTSVPPAGPAEVIPDSWGFGPVTSQPPSAPAGKRPLPTNKIDQPLYEAERKSVG